MTSEGGNNNPKDIHFSIQKQIPVPNSLEPTPFQKVSVKNRLTFDWQPIKEKGIEGFVEEADKRGILGMKYREVQKIDSPFCSTFFTWLKSQSEDVKKEYRDRVYGKNLAFDWQPIKEKGIEGFVEEADKRGILGMNHKEVRKIDDSFCSTFGAWLATQSKDVKKEYRDRVYGKNLLFDWQPVREKGIEGFVEEADKRGILGMNINEIQKKDISFYKIFHIWLKSQPENMRKEYRDIIYAKKEVTNFVPDVIKTLEIPRNKEFISSCANVFGHSNLVDIFYATNPQFRSLDNTQVKKYLAEYLGDYLTRPTSYNIDKFLNENAELTQNLLQTPNIYQAFLLNIKQESLHFYNINKKEGELEGEKAVWNYLEKISTSLDNIAKTDSTGNFREIANRVFFEINGYYLRLEELVKNKPDQIVDFLGRESSDREFPDFSQRINILELLNEKRILIADEMGMGKTASSILAKEYLENETKTKHPALVIIPKNAVGQWLEHLKQRQSADDTKACFVYDEKNPKFGRKNVLNLSEDNSDWSSLQNYSNYDYILISQEILSSAKKIEQLKSTSFSMLIVDELHLLKNTKGGKRANNLLDLVSQYSQNPDSYFIGLSGTPLPNKVQDIAIYLQTLYPDKYHPVVGQSLERYNQDLVREIIKADNLDLRAILMPRMQMKTLHENVEMPQLNNKIISYNLPQKARLIYDSLLENDEATASEKIITLRKFVMDPDLIKTLPGLEKTKIEQTNVLLNDIYNTQQKKKAIVFFNGPMKGVIRGENSTREKLNIPEGVEILTIHGEIGDDERKTIQDRFQNENGKFLLLVNSSVSGVGVDFSAGEAVIHFNEPWTMAEKRQCLARVYRPGQSKKITEYTFYAKDTIEEGIHKYIILKESIIDKILHGVPLTEIEKVQIRASEDLPEKNPENAMNNNVTGYLTSDFSKLLGMFTANKGVGEEQFLKFLEEYASDYAKLYKKITDYSYQANGNRIIASLMSNVIETREQNPQELQIADLASGPRMFWRHAPEKLQDQINSMDLNLRHFEESDKNYQIGSLQKLPYENNSLDYINLSFALHYTEFAPSKGKYERLQVFQELNRTLKVGGMAFVNQIYSQEIRNMSQFELLANQLGFEIEKNYSGQIISEENGRNSYDSNLVVLKKVANIELMKIEELFEKVNNIEVKQNELGTRRLTDILKIKNVSTRPIKKQRTLVDKFKLKTLNEEEIESMIEFNQYDDHLYKQQSKAQQEVSELLQKNGGKIENIDETTLINGDYIRYKLGKNFHLLKIVKTQYGESLLFM